MVDQYYFKNYRLFKLPSKVLLSYHCPLGNTIKLWTSYFMISNILSIRNDLQVLDLAFTIIQMKKALNSLFNKIMCRGSFLIYAQAHKALKIYHEAVFNFVNSWLPGLISNYKQIVSSLSYNRKIRSVYGGEFLKRPQLDALAASKTNAVPPASAIYYPKRLSKYPRVPSISLSVLDSAVWLNECHNLAIPSILICDSQSPYEKITFPIISNQRSVPFTHLVIGLFSEGCNYAIMMEHLHFLFFRRLHRSIRHQVNLNQVKKTRKITEVYNQRLTSYATQAFNNIAALKPKFFHKEFIKPNTYNRTKGSFFYNIRDVNKKFTTTEIKLNILKRILCIFEKKQSFIHKMLLFKKKNPKKFKSAFKKKLFKLRLARAKIDLKLCAKTHIKPAVRARRNLLTTFFTVSDIISPKQIK